MDFLTTFRHFLSWVQLPLFTAGISFTVAIKRTEHLGSHRNNCSNAHIIKIYIYNMKNNISKYFKDTITELRSSLSANETVSTTKNKVILSECEKLGNLVASLLRSSLHGTNQLSPRTTQQILQRISSDINRLKDYLSSTGIDFPVPASSSAALRSSLSSLLSRSATADQHV